LQKHSLNCIKTQLRPRTCNFGVLPQPEPHEDPAPFVLDIRNFPELANADMGSQNPNIQVTIEVVDDTQPQTEVEMDLAKEGQRNDWSVSSSEWASSHRKLFWPLFWEYPERLENGLQEGDSLEERDLSYDPEEPVLSGVGGTGAATGYEEEWSGWAPCSVSCGHGTQKRTRSCGYACVATESRTCELQSCAGESGDTDNTYVDSCEKWLSCKNDFLQKYLHQVLTELPSCPCAYPSEAVYSAVNVQDPKLRKTYRWRDASGPKERLDIYKPSARFCIRSMLSYDSTTLAAQHCCYDEQTRLITRGKGAGAPNLISTEFSPELHYKVDVLPWILCKGDWSRFHSVRPPNNGLECAQNPNEEVFQAELQEAKEY
uniref:Isthmin 2a n=1 Tax=Neogobius melanostomus TaxID=47308 RepID=A0A8C6UUC5_9GOBI